jgi:cytochrome c oxidase subunit II
MTLKTDDNVEKRCRGDEDARTLKLVDHKLKIGYRMHDFKARVKLCLLVSLSYCLIIACLLSSASAQPVSMKPPVLKDVGIDQLLNNQVPLDLEFKDETGRTVKLAEYFNDKPVVLSLVYYDCPQLCTQVLSGLLGTLKTLPMTPGKEFTAVTVSFDPREKPELAAAKKREYLERLKRPGVEEGWHFLTGEEPAIKALTKAVGFRYLWDPVTKQYAHASGIMVLTPEGKVSRYFYGIEYAPRDLRFGVMDASDGKIGSLAEQIILYCYQYDPTRGTYSLVLMRLLRIFGILTIVTLIALFLFLRYKTKQKEAEWARQMPEVGKPDSKVGYTQMSLLPLLFNLPFMPEQASNFALEIDLLYFFLIALTAAFSIAIAVAIVYFAIKYRRRSESEIPESIEGALKLEIAWTVIPFIISMFIFAWGAKLYYQMYTPPSEALEIFITGKQWMWRAQHPDGMREINELHIPVGRRIKLTMTSEDVIHSFFIPAFRTKTDVIPGRLTMSWFQPTKVGTYHLFCAEYCGTQHSGMIGKITVMEPADYQAWLGGGTKETSPVAAGQNLFASLACNTCHREESGGRGPKLVEVYGTQVKLNNGTTVTVNDDYIRESILNPTAKIVDGYQAIMPTFQGQVSEEQILQLIAYIKSIGPKQGGAEAGGATGGAAGEQPASPAPAAGPAK